MEALFRQAGIYSSAGQLYEPVDRESLLYYRESKDGQILEEGITEAGGLSSFIAAGTAYANHGINMIPFFTFYSMFGFQRVGDFIWAAADSRAKGFLLGATAGRTTLAGEGLQHQDGNSHLLAYPVPNLYAYDPAYAYELAVIIREGIRRMYENGEDVFYYITLMNENYAMPPIPEADCCVPIKQGIIEGIYRLRAGEIEGAKARVGLLGSGSLLNEALKAQGILEQQYGVGADVFSVTSYKQLYRGAMEVERHAMLHPEEEHRIPHVTCCLTGDTQGGAAPVYVAVSDYVRTLPDSIAPWVPGQLYTLGTDGFGRSETREALRDFFEVDHRYIVLAALHGLSHKGLVEDAVVSQAVRDLGIDPDKPSPLAS